MKFSAVTALAMAASVSAQSASDIPGCARPCLDSAVKGKTSCATSDYACICKAENFSAIRGAATSCVIEKCGTETAVGEVLPATQKLCAAAGKDKKPESSAPATTDAAPPTAAAPSVGTTTAPCETPSPEPAVTDCAATAPANGTAPSPSAPVIAGAAGLAPVGGLAMVAVVALAL